MMSSDDPAICHGKACVRNLRYPVASLLQMLASGMTIDDVLADYEGRACSLHSPTWRDSSPRRNGRRGFLSRDLTS